MKDLSNRIFFCYAWEDLSHVQKVVDALKRELGADINIFKGEETLENIDEKVFPKIDIAELILVFISDTSKNSQFVKKCARYSQNSNKRILPIEVGRNSMFVLLPDEFKFRTKAIDYKDENERQQFFGQMKAILGISVEGGDNYGSTIHITSDVNIRVTRYGKELCIVLAGKDCVARLNKGSHKLLFTNMGNSKESFSMTYEVKSNEGEQFIEVKFRKEMEKAAKLRQLEKEKEEKRNRPMSTSKKIGIAAGVLLSVFLVVWCVSYYNNVYLPEKIDNEADRYYVVPNSLFIRSSEVSGIENKLVSVFYGQELITYRHGTEWSHVKFKEAHERGNEGVKGYVGSRYLLKKTDFYLLNSIWGNDDAKVIAETNKCRLALLDYYKSHGYIGKMSSNIIKDIHLQVVPDRNNQWQFFALPKKSKYNNAFFKKLISSSQKYPDAFLILKNIVTGERKVVMFHYDDDETPHFVQEISAPENGVIKNVRLTKDKQNNMNINVSYSED